MFDVGTGVGRYSSLFFFVGGQQCVFIVAMFASNFVLIRITEGEYFVRFTPTVVVAE